MQSPTSNLIPISPAVLVADVWPQTDVFLVSSPTEAPVLFFTGTDDSARRSAAERVDSLYNKLFIDVADAQRYEAFVSDHWQEIINSDKLPAVDQVGLFSEVVRHLLKSEFESGNAAKILAASKELGAATCNVVADSEIAIPQLLNVLHHDYGTFTHSTNVSLFSVLLARELGMPEHELQEIAVGGLVHDLGKLQIEPAILNKPGRLTDDEFRVVKQHPTIGYRELCRQDLSFGQLMMVYQHHEKINGSGYPVGCEGDEIHPWARICTVVDVYEALTSNRPYRQPASRQAALAILNNGDGSEFDSEVLKCWRMMIEKLPQ
ncbi:MAG TPA: metal-dependent phosphohydrolase [Planctomycetaceae bacterium]|nr:metal-dependent phosphohydrolase [Planctomycetaceae bacterium]